MAHQLEWNDNKTSVTVFRDGKAVATGHGGPQPAAALFDAWTTLVDQGDIELAAAVAKDYQSLTGQEPVRP